MIGREPRVGLLLGVHPPAALVALCRELAKWVPMGDGRDGGAYDFFLWRPGDPAGPEAKPYVLFAEDTQAIDKYGKHAYLVLATSDDVIDHAIRAGFRTRLVPSHPDHARSAVPVAPFVRARIRSARGLGELAIAEQDDVWLWQESPVGDISDVLDTMLGLASAVVAVTPNDAIRALAWGAPLVTSVETARLIGATDAVNCLVASDRQLRRRRSAELSQDIRMAAKVGWHARVLYERRHSLRTCSETVLSVMGAHGTWSPSSLTSLLGELGTRPSADIVRRVGMFVDPIVQPFRDGQESRRDAA